MPVTSIADAYQVLLETLSKLCFKRFPLQIDIKPVHVVSRAAHAEHEYPCVTIHMKVLDRVSGIPRDVRVVVRVTTPWHSMARSNLEREYAKTLYQSVRQAVLHELAECCEYDGRLLDDPHDGYPHSLRPEHDERFPNFRNGY